nr:hypothetical protein [Tanacetum cinerariifolium]
MENIEKDEVNRSRKSKVKTFGQQKSTLKVKVNPGNVKVNPDKTEAEKMPTYRTAAVDVVNNDKELRLNLDLLEEPQERAAPGDFVYRSNDASHAVAGGKLGTKWEGPYEVTEALGNGAYKLWSTDGTVLPRTWNVTNLKRCYL